MKVKVRITRVYHLLDRITEFERSSFTKDHFIYLKTSQNSTVFEDLSLSVERGASSSVKILLVDEWT